MPTEENIRFEIVKSTRHDRGLYWCVRKIWEEVDEQERRYAKRSIVLRAPIEEDPKSVLMRAKGEKKATPKIKKKK